ncbi:hypothetical protein AB2888_11600 [Escherichia coli]|nr:hypothetical protein [Escherichia coli]
MPTLPRNNRSVLKSLRIPNELDQYIVAMSKRSGASYCRCLIELAGAGLLAKGIRRITIPEIDSCRKHRT